MNSSKNHESAGVPKKIGHHSSSKNWAEMIQYINQPTLLLDKDQKVVAVNKQITTSINLNVNDIIGRHCYEVFHEKGQTSPSHGCPCHAILSSNTFEVREMEIEAFGGYFLISCTPLFDNKGELQNILHIATDISEQKRTQQALIESENRYKSLISALPEGIVVHCNGIIEYVNESVCRIMKVEKDQLIGRNAIDFVHPDYRETALERIKAGLLRNQISPFIEELFINPQGNTFPVEVSAIPFDYNGKKAMLAIVNDITYKKEVEKELREQNLKIAAQNEELQKAKNKAEESDRLKSAFLANMSHEIRTPMNAICGFSDLLLDKSISDEKKQRYVEIIHTNSQQLLGIINDIIDISKIEAGQIAVNNSEFSINSLLNDIKNIFTPAVKNKDLELKCSKAFSDKDSFVISDDLKIKQIFNNLIFNAIKFTRKGYIHFGYEIENEFIKFYVKDTGIGIPEDKFDIAFARFQQIENKLAGRNGGTGLGLPISKAYTELMGGNMWLESRLGAGSVFYFTIPLVKAKVHEMPVSNTMPKTLDLKNKNILIAEDDDINFYFIEELINPTHAKLTRAKDGKEAIDFASKGNFDLILMDIKMPEIDGLSATKEIRKFNQNVPIIAQTAYAFSSDQQNAIASGCNDFIAKPVKKELLLELIEKYI